MNHVTCSRCGAALPHISAVRKHWEEAHGGIPPTWTIYPMQMSYPNGGNAAIGEFRIRRWRYIDA